MKKTMLFTFLLLMVIFVFVGCNSEAGSGEKEFQYQIKNVSGDDWVLIGDFDTDFVYTGDNYGLDPAFVIKNGKSESESFIAQRLIDSGRLDEMTEGTYKIKMRFIAGKLPQNANEDTITSGLIMQDITITGTYNKEVVVEWDGTSFKLKR